MEAKAATLLVFAVVLTFTGKVSTEQCTISHRKLTCLGLTRIPKFGEKYISALSIDLSKNAIELVPTNGFADFSHVKYLNLSRNAIKRVEQRALAHQHYEWIDLSFNKLKTLGGREVLPGDNMLYKNTVEIYLHDNPWDCTCALKWLVDLMKSDLIRALRSQPTCSTPQAVKGTKLMQLQDEDYCVIQECLECDDAADCKMKGSSYACVCKPTYNGNGKFCADIDECAKKSTNRCKPNEICENFSGSYKCTCSVGYRRDDEKCEDINECEPPPVGCGPGQGICKNTIGSFKCICHPGLQFVVDRGCIDFDECKTDEDPCKDTAYSTCVNTAVTDIGDKGYTCKCDKGYAQTGEVCIPIDSSKMNTFIIGGSTGVFVLAFIVIIVVAVLCRRKRKKKAEQEQEFVMAPVAMAAPMDFAYMDMPQEQPEELENEEWHDVDSEDFDG